jgi:hypothetical protein
MLFLQNMVTGTGGNASSGKDSDQFEGVYRGVTTIRNVSGRGIRLLMFEISQSLHTGYLVGCQSTPAVFKKELGFN